jgi:hypothetical protein
MALRQTAAAARGRQLPPGAAPRKTGDNPVRAAIPRTGHAPDRHSLPLTPVRLAYPPMYVGFMAYAVSERRASEIKRQTESCHTSISEDTSILFATRMPGMGCGSEFPLTPLKKSGQNRARFCPPAARNRPPCVPPYPPEAHVLTAVRSPSAPALCRRHRTVLTAALARREALPPPGYRTARSARRVSQPPLDLPAKPRCRKLSSSVRTPVFDSNVPLTYVRRHARPNRVP